MFEKFTDKARRVVVLAQEEAKLLNHNYIGTEHILLGLIHEGEGVAVKALDSSRRLQGAQRLCADGSRDESRPGCRGGIGAQSQAMTEYDPYTKGIGVSIFLGGK